jgi:hypothetical protein
MYEWIIEFFSSIFRINSSKFLNNNINNNINNCYKFEPE